MFRRILLMGTTLTIAHFLTVVSCGGAYLGIARAVRDLPDRNPPVLQFVTAAGDLLMFPTSLVFWLWRGVRFPWSTDGLLFTSPIWGFGLAYLLKRRRHGPAR